MRIRLAIITAAMAAGALFQAHCRDPFLGEPSTFLLAVSGLVVFVLLRGGPAVGAVPARQTDLRLEHQFTDGLASGKRDYR